MSTKNYRSNKGLVERRFGITNTSSATDSRSMSSCELRQIEQNENVAPKIVGYTAVFGVETLIESFFGSFKEKIQKGAFRRAIREGQNVRALRNHEPDNLLGSVYGKTLRMKEDDIGLYIEIEPSDTTISRDTIEMVRRGDMSGMSFAFIVRGEKWISTESGDLRVIQDVDLFDVGPVTYPAYEQTSTDLRSASAIHQIGLAELGKSVPVMPEEFPQSHESQGSILSGVGSESSDSRSDDSFHVEIPPAPSSVDYVIRAQARLRLSDSYAFENQNKLNLLTKN